MHGDKVMAFTMPHGSMSSINESSEDSGIENRIGNKRYLVKNKANIVAGAKERR